MHVVLSSGTQTPNPSPRLPRKNYPGYGRPVMPGYHAGTSQPHPAPAGYRPTKESTAEEDSQLKNSIPVMTKRVAVTCLILNIVIPGLGEYELVSSSHPHV